MIWGSPDVTGDRLLFNVLWSIWMVIATQLEERDLSAEFGDGYRRYQRRVPMLVPHSLRRSSSSVAQSRDPRLRLSWPRL